MIAAIQASADSSFDSGAASSLSAQPEVRTNPLCVSSACQTLDIARSTFYRNRSGDPLDDPHMDLRDQIQKISLAWSAYGYRRITAELRRQGRIVNHKLVLRLMREDNLLCLRKRRFVIATTDSSHGLPVYPNLAKEIIPVRCDQLWVSDITYIRLGREFVYLAVVLDAFSRKVVGWQLSRRIDAALALDALDMAVADRRPEPGTLIHHSDRGGQYASADYIRTLTDNKITVSMSRKGAPQDNAFAESFMKTLKYEEVYMTEYDNIADARNQIGYFLEEVYNKKRLHSSLGYMPPAEFETVSRYKKTAP
jgi:transposase InsO family protein